MGANQVRSTQIKSQHSGLRRRETTTVKRWSRISSAGLGYKGRLGRPAATLAHWMESLDPSSNGGGHHRCSGLRRRETTTVKRWSRISSAGLGYKGRLGRPAATLAHWMVS